MTGTHTAAACLVERGQSIRVELPSGEVVEGVVRARRNTELRSRLKDSDRTFLRTHLYFEDGTKRALSQLTKVTITKEANG